MKLRIKGNSLRIRVSQSELERFAERGRVGDRIDFGTGRGLSYALERTPDGTGLGATFEGDAITVTVPRALAEPWTGTGQVSLSGEQALADGSLRLLVEKDFQCLAPREDEDESDLFAHPLAGGPGC